MKGKLYRIFSLPNVPNPFANISDVHTYLRNVTQRHLDTLMFSQSIFELYLCICGYSVREIPS